MIDVRLANELDIPALVQCRIEYLDSEYAASSYGPLSEVEKETLAMDTENFLHWHLNQDQYAAIVYVDDEPACCAFMGIDSEAPNLIIPTGTYGEIYGVYTNPEHRHHGYAAQCMSILERVARDVGASYLKLESTEMGYGLYCKLGFQETSYTPMKKWLVATPFK